MIGKLEAYYLAQQYKENMSVEKSADRSFAQLVGAKSIENEASADKASAKNYMGTNYQEHLNKITDPVAKSAFQQAYALKMAGSTDYISTISKAYSTGKVGATNFEDAFSKYEVITHVGNAKISDRNWQRNDFPFWKYFDKNTSADALNNWKPVGANPSQLRSDLQKSYSSIGSGKIAVLVPESLQQKMDADPEYAKQIIAKLQEWKEDYDRWNNATAASHGCDNIAEYQASLNYVFDLDENGDIRHCTVSGSGGRLTGPTKEEQEQFEAEQAKKRKRMTEYKEFIEESSLKRAEAEQEANKKYYIAAMVKDTVSVLDYGKGFTDMTSIFNITRMMKGLF